MPAPPSQQGPAGAGVAVEDRTLNQDQVQSVDCYLAVDFFFFLKGPPMGGGGSLARGQIRGVAVPR